MSAYVALLVIALGLLSIRGFPDTATAIAAGLAAFAAVLDASYIARRWRRRALVLAHRRTLDRVVRAQWLLLIVVGCGMTQALGAADIRPLADDGPLVQGVVFALNVGIATIYASSLVDWYWILPKVSGITAPPPCTRVGGKTYEGVTKIWFFHRVVATTTITFLLAGTPAYIAGTIEGDGSERTLLTLLGTLFAIGFNAVNAGTGWAFKQFLGPRLLVGGWVRKRKDIDDSQPQDGYIVDVAIQGVKVKLVGDVDGGFVDDGDLMPFGEADRVTKGSRSTPFCPSIHQCRAINWYCVRNRNANGTLAPNEHAPAALPAAAAALD